MSEVGIKRAYDPTSDEDGMRVLVDRLWPRGLKREDARVDLWLKEVARSAALRRWFAHDPAKWPEFQDRYRAELAGNAAIQELTAVTSRCQRATLLFGARDMEHNNAVVLRAFCPPSQGRE